MSLPDILNSIVIVPLKLLFEVIFNVAYQFTANPGISIIFLSLAINILVLPLYRRADALQEEERVINLRLQNGVKHIKKTFHGDEQMMMLQTYYRQNHYKPTYVLRGALPLFLEIPFFIAAYQFLSGLEVLKGVPFGFISDLGKPDGMIHLFGWTGNILPVLMTLINVVSTLIYTRDYPLKTKLQLYCMALFFLVFLFDSPSGLVFYWTLNNLFSLVKTIFYKLKNPKKVLVRLCAVLGVFLLAFLVIRAEQFSSRQIILVAAVAAALILPFLYGLLRSVLPSRSVVSASRKEPKLGHFLSGGFFMTILTGVWIPASVISASPQEFIFPGSVENPLVFILSAACIAAGFFLVWMTVFYYLSVPKIKRLFEYGIWAVCVVSVINFMFFGNNLGIISSMLKYEEEMAFSVPDQLINVLVTVAAGGIAVLLARRFNSLPPVVTRIGAFALCIMSVVSMVGINRSVAGANTEDRKDNITFSLSRNGKNVVVMMIDRALGEYIPYIMNEKPELQDTFDGFTYYHNTVSYGAFTNFGTPGLYGGYEYIPEEMNRRDSETLEAKQNEALRVLPVLFSREGYDVTVIEPTYAGYQWIPDLSIFDDYPEIHTYLRPRGITNASANMRNFFCYSIVKCVPLMLRTSLYTGGSYRSMDDNVGQILRDLYHADGRNADFMINRAMLDDLPVYSQVAEDSVPGSYIVMSNDITHWPTLLQTPEYEVARVVNNEPDPVRTGMDGSAIELKTTDQAMHYHANMAAMISLSKWFAYLKENDLYDNTRIILVSDHGEGLEQFEDLSLRLSDGRDESLEYYFPLLMVKDFDAHGFEVSEDFMTNADVPTLATKELIADPVNPFTGKVISDEKKSNQDAYLITSHDWSTDGNTGTTFPASDWLLVRDNIWDIANWTVAVEKSILPE